MATPAFFAFFVSFIVKLFFILTMSYPFVNYIIVMDIIISGYSIKNSRLGKRVIVIGAGNVAMDVARTAIRKGVQELTCFSITKIFLPHFTSAVLLHWLLLSPVLLQEVHSGIPPVTLPEAS